MPTPHRLTIEVLDAFGTVAGTAVVKWADVKWDAGAINEAHRVFDMEQRLSIPLDPREDQRMIWSLRTRPLGS